MNAKTKTVYYCDHCKKHGLSRPAMENHERKCVRNPVRVCFWGSEHRLYAAPLAAEVRKRAPLTEEDIAWLHDELYDEANMPEACPACMLAVLLQSGVEYHYNDHGGFLWRYEDAVKAFREAEREEELDQERRDLEHSFL